MYCRTHSATILGVKAKLVLVEADIGDGLPMFDMVGLLSSEVKEAKERVRTAIKNSRFAIPSKRITINLSPADLRKAGSYFDLPIAMTILCGLGYVSESALRDCLFVGELNLDGRVSKVNGIISILTEVKNSEIRYCFIPAENRFEGGAFQGIDVIGVVNLAQVVDFLNGHTEAKPEYINLEKILEQSYEIPELDFGNIRGQETIKRGTKVAVAGMHNMMMIGPPGSGKTMTAKCIPTILPRLTVDECLEISKIHSIAGLLENQPFVLQRPFREVHHTITVQALAGGGNHPKPGEITLAHKGVLFLDEYPEFNQRVLEVLRQPLEDKKIVISRVNSNYIFPADFMMVAAMNPCKCGYYPDRNRCSCTDYDIDKYLRKLSGPLIDRIDIGLYAHKVQINQLENENTEENSAVIREQIETAREIQQKRYRNTGIRFNSRLSADMLSKYCILEKEAKKILEEAYIKMELSVRGYHKIIKVARTIADLSQCETIGLEHAAEAISYRVGDIKNLVS